MPALINDSKLNIKNLKQILVKTLSREERLEFIKYLEDFGTCDVINKLPINITTMIFFYFAPKELCALRLVSRSWNRKVIHDSVWKPICVDYSIIPKDDYQTNFQNCRLPIYHDLFRRSLTMAASWKSLRCKRVDLKYHTGPVLSMLIAHATRVFTGDIDGKIHVWDAQNETYVSYIQAHKSHVSCLAHKDQFLASGSSDNTICIHNIVDFKHQLTLQGHEGPVTALAYSSQKHEDKFYPLISGSVDRTIRIWDTGQGSCVRILHGQDNTIQSLVYCPTFPLNFCQSDTEIDYINSNKAGFIISGSSDHNIYLWDLKTCIVSDTSEVISTIMETNGPVTALAVYDEFEGDCSKNQSSINEYVIARQPINIPTFVAYAGLKDTELSVFSLPGMEKTYVELPNIHRGTIWSVSTAVIHSKLVTTSSDRTAILWDLKSPKTSITLGGFDSAVISSSISPQEEIMCFGTEKGTIVLFDLQEFS